MIKFAAAITAAAIVSLPLMEEGRIELRALFERAPGVLGEETENHAVSTHLLVARLDADGKVITSCVDTEKSALRFFEADVEKIDGKQKREQ